MKPPPIVSCWDWILKKSRKKLPKTASGEKPCLEESEELVKTRLYGFWKIRRMAPEPVIGIKTHRGYKPKQTHLYGLLLYL